MTANAEGLEWRQARQYLIQSSVRVYLRGGPGGAFAPPIKVFAPP